MLLVADEFTAENGALTPTMKLRRRVIEDRYRRQIELSTALSETEKKAAFQALEAILEEVRTGTLSDFRMIIRGQQRTTHSDSERVSGRARELAVMPRHQATEDFRLPARTDRGHAVGLLERADCVDHLSPAHQEIVHLVVDLVDLAAQVVQGPVRVGHGGKGLPGGR